MMNSFLEVLNFGNDLNCFFSYFKLTAFSLEYIYDLKNDS